MIKKEITEHEIKLSGFQKIQADINKTAQEIANYEEQLKDLKVRKTILIEEGKKESAEYKNIQKEIQTVTKSLKDQRQAMDAHYSKLKLGEMSYSQLKKRASELASQLKRTSQAAEPERYAKLKDELDRVTNQMGKVQVGAKQAGNVFQNMGTFARNALSVFAGNIMTKGVQALGQLVGKAKEFVKEGMEMAAKAEGVQTAFNKLNDKNLLSDLRTATKGTVNDLALMQAAVKAENFQIPLEGLGSLLKFAQQRAQETGESVDYLTESIVNGIGRKSPLILDNLGISTERLRNKVKEVGDFSTAAIAIVNEELEKQGDLALTSADKAQQSAVKWENAQLRVGQRFKWLKDAWDDVSGFFADTISKIAGDTRTANERFEEQVNTVVNLEAKVRPLAQRYDELKSKVGLTVTEQTELTKVTKELARAFPSAVTEMDKYGNALSINTEKIYKYLAAEKARLNYVHRDAIKDAREDQRDAESDIVDLQKEEDAARTIMDYWQAQVDKFNKTGGLTRIQESYLRELEKATEKFNKANGKLIERQEDLLGIETQLSELTGKSLDEFIQRSIFNDMSKEALTEWIADEENAKNDFIDIAKEVLAAKRDIEDPGGDNGGSGGKASAWSLNNDEAYQQQRLALKQQHLAGEIATEKEYKDQLLQLEIDTLAQRIALNQDSADTLQSLNEQLTDKLIEQQKGRTETELRLNKLIEDAQTDLIEKERQAHQQRLEEYDLDGTNRERMTQTQLNALEILERQHRANLDKIENDAIAAAINDLQAEFDRKLTLRKTQQNEELAALGDNARARKALEEEHQREIEAMTAEHLQTLMTRLQDAINSGTFEGLNIGDAILSEEQKQELEKRLEEVGLKLSEILAAAGAVKSGEKESEFSAAGAKMDLFGLTPDDWNLLFQHLEEGKLRIEDMFAAMTVMLSALKIYDSFVTASENRQLEQSRKTNDKKKDQLKKRLDAGRMSQEQYNTAIEAMDAEYDRQKEDLEKRQARRQKTQSIIDSLINTAVGVTAALRSANIPLSVVIGAMGAVQTALIAAQPVSGREKGGFVVEREQDGKMFNAEFAPRKRGKITKPTILAGENGDEYVIPASGMDNPTLSPIIRSIEDARLRGNLREFNFSNIQPVQVVGRETGGFAGTSSTETNQANTEQMTESNIPPALLEVLQKLSKQLDRPITAIVTLLGKGGLLEKMEEYERTKNKGKIA